MITVSSMQSQTNAELAVIPSCSGVNLSKEKSYCLLTWKVNCSNTMNLTQLNPVGWQVFILEYFVDFEQKSAQWLLQCSAEF